MIRKRKKASHSRTKQYVIDTNVLVHDPRSIFEFEENTVWLPVEVLEELDRFKPEATTRGANAREVHRHLSERFKNLEDMRAGVALENGGRIRVAVQTPLYYDGDKWVASIVTEKIERLRSLFPDLTSPDNRILAVAAYLADTEAPPIILVTKDLNMQLKARALGLEAQDYRTDRVEDSDINRTRHGTSGEEYPTLQVDPHALQGFASTGRITVPDGAPLGPNEYALLVNCENPNAGIPARHRRDGEFHRLLGDGISIRNGKTLKPLNLGQHFLIDALYDPDITLVTVYGKAGTGKTILSVGAALQQVIEGSYEKLLITRVIMPTGRDIGFLPGRKDEKMQPWVQPAYDALEMLLSRPKKPEQFERKRQSQRKLQPPGAEPHNQGQNGRPQRPYEALLQNGTIEIEAIAHIRGRSIPDAVFIVDEAQQLTPHEAKTIVTRMGRGSKLILIGDLAQIDNPYVDANTNGLVYTRNRLQGQEFMAHVNLFKGERSGMAEVAANLM